MKSGQSKLTTEEIHGDGVGGAKVDLQLFVWTLIQEHPLCAAHSQRQTSFCPACVTIIYDCYSLIPQFLSQTEGVAITYSPDIWNAKCKVKQFITHLCHLLEKSEGY